MPQRPEKQPHLSKNLTPEQRKIAFSRLLARSSNFRLEYGAIKQISTDFGCSARTIARLWKRGVEGLRQGKTDAFLARRRGRCGRKRLFTAPQAVQLWERIELIPLAERTDFRTLAERTGISKSTLVRSFKDKLFRRHTSVLRPLLTNNNRIERLKFASSFVDESTGLFSPFLNHVHVDEKWFYMRRVKQKYYLSPREEDPPPHHQEQDVH